MNEEKKYDDTNWKEEILSVLNLINPSLQVSY